MTRHVTVVRIPKKAQAKLVQQLRPLKAPAEQPDYTPRGRQNPLALAGHVLGGRLGENADSLLLDGQGANLDRVMRAANQVLHERGLPQITLHPAWRYDPPPA